MFVHFYEVNSLFSYEDRTLMDFQVSREVPSTDLKRWTHSTEDNIGLISSIVSEAKLQIPLFQEEEERSFETQTSRFHQRFLMVVPIPIPPALLCSLDAVPFIFQQIRALAANEKRKQKKQSHFQELITVLHWKVAWE